MKYLILLSLLLYTPALAVETYQTENVSVVIEDNGNWNLNLDGINYKFTWIEDMLKVTGDDGICYYVYGDSQTMDCSLKELSILLGKI